MLVCIVSLGWDDQVVDYLQHVVLTIVNIQSTGQIDTNLCISATMEKRLSPMPFLFTLSAYANHVKGMYRFGIGMIIG